MNVLGLVRGSHGVSFVLLGIMSAPLEFYGVLFVLLRILLVFGLARWGCFISWFCGDLVVCTLIELVFCCVGRGEKENPLISRVICRVD